MAKASDERWSQIAKQVGLKPGHLARVKRVVREAASQLPPPSAAGAISTILTAHPSLEDGRAGTDNSREVAVMASILAQQPQTDGKEGQSDAGRSPVTNRLPLNLICVIDVSGSMSVEAVIKEAGGKQQAHGLSQADLVCHAVRTIVASLGPEDILGLVVYSSSARTILEPAKMDATGKENAGKALDRIAPNGQTNLWEGLKLGLDDLAKAGAMRSRGRGEGEPDPCFNAAVMLMTDGLPNIVPEAGHMASLQSYIAQNPDPRRSIHTFGFGYKLDTKLLCDIADTGNGSYAFIPDSGMVGTVFVNATANLLAARTSSAELSIVAKNGASVGRVMANEALGMKKPSQRVGLGPLIYGQRKSLIFTVLLPESADGDANMSNYVDVTLRAGPGDDSGSARWADTRAKAQQAAADAAAAGDLARSAAVDELLRLIETHQLPKKVKKESGYGSVWAFFRDSPRADKKLNLKNAQMDVAKLIARVHQLACLLSDAPVDFAKENVAKLQQDLKGQVCEAVSNETYYTKWGVHYLPSLARAHRHMITNNFKDPGVQPYAGKLFTDIRKRLDEVFVSLPAPKPIHLRQMAKLGFVAPQGHRSQPRVRMNAYYNARGACFAHGSAVRMAQGDEKMIEQLRAGDRVLDRHGHIVRVACVVRTRLTHGDVDMVTLPRPDDSKKRGLTLTPYHPVFDVRSNQWVFPITKSAPKRRACPAMYSVLLEAAPRGSNESRDSIIVNGIAAVSLGHGVKEGVAAHPYFGNRERIVADLSSMRGWDDGYVCLSSGSLRRDPETGLVCGLVQQSHD